MYDLFGLLAGVGAATLTWFGCRLVAALLDESIRRCL